MTLKILFTKLRQVFKQGLIIDNFEYVYPDAASYEKISADVYIRLSDEASFLLIDLFGKDNKVIVIDDISNYMNYYLGKEINENDGSSVHFSITDTIYTLERLRNLRDKMISLVDDRWEISSLDLKKLLTDNHYVNISLNEFDSITFTDRVISKTVLNNAKKLETVLCTVDEDVKCLLLKYDYIYFDIIYAVMFISDIKETINEVSISNSENI